jgi:hypothetical protein
MKSSNKHPLGLYVISVGPLTSSACPAMFQWWCQICSLLHASNQCRDKFEGPSSMKGTWKKLIASQKVYLSELEFSFSSVLLLFPFQIGIFILWYLCFLGKNCRCRMHTNFLDDRRYTNAVPSMQIGHVPLFPLVCPDNGKPPGANLILRRQAARFPVASLYTAASIGAVVTSFNADAEPSPPPSTPHHRLPQCWCRTVAASLDAASSPPSTQMLRRRRLTRCSLPRHRTVAASTSPSPRSLHPPRPSLTFPPGLNVSLPWLTPLLEAGSKVSLNWSWKQGKPWFMCNTMITVNCFVELIVMESWLWCWNHGHRVNCDGIMAVVMESWLSS